MRSLLLVILALSSPASAVCWTSTSPAKFCTAPITAAKYEWVDQTGAVIATSVVPSVSIQGSPNTLPLKLQVRSISPSGTSPLSPPSSEVYVTAPFGADLDGSGTVNSLDFTMAFIPTFLRGCSSCTPQNSTVTPLSSAPRLCPY